MPSFVIIPNWLLLINKIFFIYYSNKDQIKKFLTLKLPLASIQKIINKQLTAPLTYNSYKFFVEHNQELKKERVFGKKIKKVKFQSGLYGLTHIGSHPGLNKLIELIKNENLIDNILDETNFENED